MQAELKVRRARRDDFGRVQAMLGTSGLAARADRKRFRRLVSTLREDLYLVERAGEQTLAGLAVIIYTRGLGPATAIVRSLHGTSEAAALLLDCARARAAARGCARLEVHLDADGAPTTTALTGDEWAEGPRTLRRAVPPRTR